MPPVVARTGVVIAARRSMLVASWKAPAQAGAAAIALALSATLLTFSVAPVESYRSFFGVHRLVESPDGAFTVLMSGTTVHGAERIGGDRAAGAADLLHLRRRDRDRHRRGPRAHRAACFGRCR